MPVREQRRTPASFPIIMHEYASSDSSASPRDLSSGSLIVTIPASPTTDLDISEAALHSPEYNMQGPNLACDPEQLDYPANISEAAIYSPEHSMQGPNPEQLEYLYRLLVKKRL